VIEPFVFEDRECWIDIHRGNISKVGMGVEYKVKIKYGEQIHKLSFRCSQGNRLVFSQAEELTVSPFSQNILNFSQIPQRNLYNFSVCSNYE
jgi:hypothetical protein